VSQPARELDLAIACRAAGKIDEAVEHYRSAARGFLAAGSVHNAVAVCESLLGLAPDDPVATALLGQVHPEDTPLPPPMPYHVADPTTRLRKPGAKPSEPDIAASTIPSLLAATDIDSLDTPYDVAAELETRRRPLIEEAELMGVIRPPPTAPVDRLDPDDVVTPVPLGDVLVRERDTDQELPRDSIDVTNPNQPVTSVSQMLLSGALFAGIPAPSRAAVLTRFARKIVPATTVVIRRGETDHPLVVVGRGKLAVRAERSDGRLVTLFDVVAGDHVGEGALLARRPAPVHVVALSECELLLLPPHEFYEIAGAFPALWARLKDVAAKRAKEFPALA